VSRSTLRFLDTLSLSSYLSDAGLEVDEQFGDWNRDPLTATSPARIPCAGSFGGDVGSRRRAAVAVGVGVCLAFARVLPAQANDAQLLLNTTTLTYGGIPPVSSLLSASLAYPPDSFGRCGTTGTATWDGGFWQYLREQGGGPKGCLLAGLGITPPASGITAGSHTVCASGPDQISPPFSACATVTVVILPTRTIPPPPGPTPPPVVGEAPRPAKAAADATPMPTTPTPTPVDTPTVATATAPPAAASPPAAVGVTRPVAAMARPIGWTLMAVAVAGSLAAIALLAMVLWRRRGDRPTD